MILASDIECFLNWQVNFLVTIPGQREVVSITKSGSMPLWFS